MRSGKMQIGAEQIEAQDGRRFERRSPATGAVVASYPEAGPADVALAAVAARRLFDDGKWAAAVKPRVQVLRRAAELVRAGADGLARLIAEEVGKPLRMAKAEVAASADVLDHFAALALDLHGEVYAQQVPDALGLILREPVGVVGIITPWNFPLALIVWKLAAALAAGCTAVCKPSHLAPGCALELGRLLLEAGLPPGAFNLVTGAADNGAVVGQALIGSPLVDKIAFTGSTATGKKVMAAAASSLKKVSLELGGKSPNVVFADAASLDAAAQGAFSAIFANSGQICHAGSRLLVQDAVRTSSSRRSSPS
jgi:acyl-CoA reductase-like NAD-dependent aldehyde dehydrogenase